MFRRSNWQSFEACINNVLDKFTSDAWKFQYVGSETI